MMKRDGYNESLWQQAQAPSIKKTELPATTKIVIAGAGITGLSLGLRLQKAGLECCIVEARSIGFGTSLGTTAHINTVLDTNYKIIIDKFGKEHAERIARLTEEAVAFIEENVRALNIDCGFEKTDGITFAAEESQNKDVEEILESTKEVGLSINEVKEIPVPIPFTKAVRFTGQAKFNPGEYIAALAEAFVAAGGTIIENCKVVSVDDEDEKVFADTSTGKIQCEKFVWATHTVPGINILSFRLAPYRSYAMAIELSQEQNFTELVYDCNDPYYYFRTQKVDGVHYLIAGGEDHKTGHAENTAQCFRNLEAHVRKYFEFDSVAKKWSSQYYEPADGIPYIGKIPLLSDTNIFVATGYGGNGITYSAIAALLLSEWLITGECKDGDLFNPRRIKPIAGFNNFIKENADVVKEMVSGWFSAEKIETLADLAPGEGKVVKYDGHKLGLHKDDAGKLHAIHTTCSHAGCTIAWNDTERSWDCPCHGARYDEKGETLTGPAVKNLKPVDITAEV